MQVTEPIVTRAPDPDWSGWEKWLRSHLDIEREVMIEAFGEALGISCPELRDRISPLELKLAELTGAIDILRGLQPPPPAKFQTIRAWGPDTIYHEGAIVAFAGGTWQAQRDTARVPGAQDWVCLPRARIRSTQGQAEAILPLIHASSALGVGGRDIIENDGLAHWR